MEQEALCTEKLDASPPGRIRVVSVCAGDGRDLLGTLANHPRAKDVHTRLVEINPQLVERGRASIESLGLAQHIEFINGDATISSNYVGAVPADIVIVCGIFGNLADEAELNRLLANLSFLSKQGAFVIWTRGHFNGIPYSETVRRLCCESGFEEVNSYLAPLRRKPYKLKRGTIKLHEFYGLLLLNQDLCLNTELLKSINFSWCKM